ncbi:MAG: SPOR domain-containing protein, partial [Fimbriimonadaceae bacterium]|nr:SPOR domain-containing protein [Alphaproteobacteria bacterium]
DAALAAARQSEYLDENDFQQNFIEPTFDAPVAKEPSVRNEPVLEPTQYVSSEAGNPYEDPAFADDEEFFDDGYGHSFDDNFGEPVSAPPAYVAPPVDEGHHPVVAPHVSNDDHLALDRETRPASEPQRRRGAIFAVGLLLGLAVVGGSLAFAFLGVPSGEQNGGDAPVLRANSDPTKVTPDDPGGQAVQHQNSLVYQENGTANSNEQLVPREEQIVGVPKVTPKDTARPGMPSATLPLPLQPNANGAGSSAPVPLGTAPGTTAISPTSPPPAVNVAPTPRRVRTVVVRPDGTVVANEQPVPSATDNPPTSATAPSAVPIPSARPAQPQDSQVVQPQQNNQAAQPSPQTPQAATLPPANPVPSGNAPVRLTPPARSNTAQQQAVAATQTAPAPAPTAEPATGSGQFVVQVAARRSEEQANAAFTQLQSQYGSQVGRYKPLIQRADLGDRGVYYRLQIGPMASHSEAQQVCDNLKSAGLSDCLVRPR